MSTPVATAAATGVSSDRDRSSPSTPLLQRGVDYQHQHQQQQQQQHQHQQHLGPVSLSSSATSTSQTPLPSGQYPSAAGPSRSAMDTLFTRLTYYVPVLGWAPSYTLSTLTRDIVAGLTLSALLVPQALSYGALTHAGEVTGLYTAFVPGIVYAFMGTSRHLSIGPESLVSLLVGATVLEYQKSAYSHDPSMPPSATRDASTMILAFMALVAGLCAFSLGIVRLGFLDAVISRALLRGFISAAAVVIIANQSIPLIGLEGLADKTLDEHSTTWDKLKFLGHNWKQGHHLTAYVGVGALSFLVLMRILKRYAAKQGCHLQKRCQTSDGGSGTRFKIAAARWIQHVPEILVAVIVATLLSSRLDWESQGIAVFGKVDGAALPSFRLPKPPPLTNPKELITSAMLVAVIGIVESVIIAREYAVRGGYAVSPNRELVAIGVANIAGAFFGAYPSFGSLSRSKVNDRAGARSQVSGLVASLVVGITLFAFLSLLHHLPKAVQSAVVVNTGFMLLAKTPSETSFMIRLRAWPDFLLMLTTFVATMVASIEVGLLLAIVASIVIVLRRTARPRIMLLGRAAGTTDQFVPLVNSHFEGAQDANGGNGEVDGFQGYNQQQGTVVPLAGILLVRINEALYFANTGQLQARLHRLERHGDLSVHPSEPTRLPPISAVVFDFEHVPSVDASALAIIREILDQYRHRRIAVAFAHVNQEVFGLFERGRLVVSLCGGEDAFCSSITEAVNYVETRMMIMRGNLNSESFMSQQALLRFGSLMEASNGGASHANSLLANNAAGIGGGIGGGGGSGNEQIEDTIVSFPAIDHSVNSNNVLDDADSDGDLRRYSNDFDETL
ncbi:hypothetical protein GQ42DRAFT_160873 [Ramicandelaber brevisporus]|nr:hypothetical protein GQ42DRAFT_160873 [Ramicandelaber brevisporus]